MNTLVVYDSTFGNTEQLARAIAGRLGALGPVGVRAVGATTPRITGQVDLLVIGGPTQGHGMSSQMRAFTDSLEGGSLQGTRGAVFDTRLRMPALLTGSAAKRIARRSTGCAG